MENAPIDALISCQYQDSLTDRTIFEAKNLLIGALTNTHSKKASTTELMVLSGKTLHLFIYAHEQFGTTLKGPKEQHIIFTEENLANATLLEQKISLTKSIVANQEGAMKEYPNQLITFTGHDGKTQSFLLYSQTSFGMPEQSITHTFKQAGDLQAMMENTKKVVNQQVISAYFIQQLKSQFISIKHTIVE